MEFFDFFCCKTTFYDNSPENNEKLIRLEEIHNNLSETSLSGTRTFLQTRETYMKNLKTLYDIDYEHHESSLNDGDISFYLIHVPFSTLETYAIELQINKRVNEDYVNMAQSNVSFEEILRVDKNHVCNGKDRNSCLIDGKWPLDPRRGVFRPFWTPTGRIWAELGRFWSFLLIFAQKKRKI